MKFALILAAALALALIFPGPRERIVRFASDAWNNGFSTMKKRSTISAESRQEDILRRSQLQPPAPAPNPLRSVSAELKGMREESY